MHSDNFEKIIKDPDQNEMWEEFSFRVSEKGILLEDHEGEDLSAHFPDIHELTNKY